MAFEGKKLKLEDIYYVESDNRSCERIASEVCGIQGEKHIVAQLDLFWLDFLKVRVI